MSRFAVTTRLTAAIMTTATTVAVPGFLPQPPEWRRMRSRTFTTGDWEQARPALDDAQVWASMSRSAVTTRVTPPIMTTATIVAVPGFLPQPPRRPLERLDGPTVVHGPATGGWAAAGLRRRLRRRPPSDVTTSTTADVSERESAAAARPRRGRLASRGAVTGSGCLSDRLRQPWGRCGTVPDLVEEGGSEQSSLLDQGLGEPALAGLPNTQETSDAIAISPHVIHTVTCPA